MKQSNSQELLAQFVRNGSEQAFRELVVRYLDLVYSTAVRCVEGDTHKAEDVAQTVFADLARLASKLSKDTMLGGWLHRHTCYVAATLMRGERRRMARERQALEMNLLNASGEPGLAQLAAQLDAAINQLDDDDRTAILLRFYERLDLRSVGMALGSSENAAQKRVSRALDQLHSILTRQGVTISIGALTAILGAEAVTAAPAGLAASIVSAAMAGAAAGAGVSVTLLKFPVLTKLKIAGAAAVLGASIVTPLWWQHQSAVQLGAENERLRQQLAQRPPVPDETLTQPQLTERRPSDPPPMRQRELATIRSDTRSLNPGGASAGLTTAKATTIVPGPAIPLLAAVNRQQTKFYATTGSSIKLAGKSNIHDWQAESSIIGGILEVGPGFPIEPGQKAKPDPVEAHAESFVLVQSLKSVDQNGRPYSDKMDELLHDALKGRTHPKISYRLTDLSLTQPAKNRDDPNLFEAEGELAVAGVTNSITVPVSVLAMRDKKLKVSGKTTVKMSDFEIDPSACASALGLLRVADEVDLSFVWVLSQRKQDASVAGK